MSISGAFDSVASGCYNFLGFCAGQVQNSNLCLTQVVDTIFYASLLATAVEDSFQNRPQPMLSYNPLLGLDLQQGFERARQESDQIIQNFVQTSQQINQQFFQTFAAQQAPQGSLPDRARCDMSS